MRKRIQKSSYSTRERYQGGGHRFEHWYVDNQVYFITARHGICADPQAYPHTRVNVELPRALARAIELKAFMEAVPYPRYQRSRPDTPKA